MNMNLLVQELVHELVSQGQDPNIGLLIVTCIILARSYQGLLTWLS